MTAVSEVHRPFRAASLLLVGIAALSIAGCSGAHTPSAVPSDGSLVHDTAPTPSLANNIVGDAAQRELIVYLPPSYESSPEQRYPVVYFLAGSDTSVGMLATYSDALWTEMLSDDAREFIIVEVDGRSEIGDNFYANSPVAGNAEDALTQDLVSHVDENYRTIADASSRGLSGFSMGGSGTINAGLTHPDVYGALYAFSPGLFEENTGLAAMLNTAGAWRAYGAAFAPDPTAEFPHMVAIDPKAPLEDQDPAIVAAWENGYGNLRAKVANYLAQPDRLAIRVAYGSADFYSWIPEGSAFFLSVLEENDVPATSHVFDGGHNLDDATFANDFVSYFSQELAGDS
jgi:S-formylglutathione hydrolase FrmB